MYAEHTNFALRHELCSFRRPCLSWQGNTREQADRAVVEIDAAIIDRNSSLADYEIDFGNKGILGTGTYVSRLQVQHVTFLFICATHISRGRGNQVFPMCVCVCDVGVRVYQEHHHSSSSH